MADDMRRYSRLGVVATSVDSINWTWKVEDVSWKWDALTGVLWIVGTIRTVKACVCMSVSDAVAYTAGVRDGSMWRRRGGLPTMG